MTLKECLRERLAMIDKELKSLDVPCDRDELFSNSEAVNGAGETMNYAVGFIEGVAAALDMTPLEVLDGLGSEEG